MLNMAAGGADYTGYSAENYGYGSVAQEYGSGAGGAAAGAGGHFNPTRGAAVGAVPAAVPYGYGFGAVGAAYAEVVPSPLDAEIAVVCREIQGEIHALEQSGEYGEQFKNARRLLTTEANKLENSIDPEWLEVDINKPIKVTKKILIPSFRHPKFNFVGKVLGPKGATLQNIAKNFKCHVYILGRGSTRDRAKEQELLQSGDPQFSHYGGPLHVKVETTAAPAIAYQRVAGVLGVLSQLLVPVKDTTIDGITTVNEDYKEGGGGEEENDVGGGGVDADGNPENGNSGGAEKPPPPQAAPKYGGGGGNSQNRGGGYGTGGGGGGRGGGGGGGDRGGSRGGGYGGRGGGGGGGGYQGRGAPRGGGGGAMRGGGRGGAGSRPGYQPY